MKESDLVAKIKKHCAKLRAAGVPIKCLKIHGNQFTEQGTPDLHVTIEGRSLWVECKVGCNHPTSIQVVRLREWESAGATVAVVRSLDEFKDALTRARTQRIPGTV